MRKQKDFSKAGLSNDSIQWLTVALDPFHDTNTSPSGFPDLSGDSTIVQCYKSTITYTNNSDTVADVHIHSNPDISTRQLRAGLNQLSDNISNPIGPAITYGALNFYGVPTGGTTFPNFAGTMSPALSTGFIGPPATVLEGNGRLIAFGFEVTNTTPAIIAGGSVVVYKQPAFSRDGCVTQSGTRDTFGVVSNGWPSTVAEALTLPGSKQYNAVEGNYNVATLCDVSNPLNSRQFGQRQYLNQSGNATSGCMTDASAVATGLFGAPAMYNTPFDITGAYYTGLPINSTLQITGHWYIERAPAVTQFDLVLLSTPSAEFDPRVFEIYSKIVRDLPAGVPVGQNAEGDWWDTILDVYSRIASIVSIPVGMAYPMAGAGIAATGVGAANYVELTRKVAKLAVEKALKKSSPLGKSSAGMNPNAKPFVPRGK